MYRTVSTAFCLALLPIHLAAAEPLAPVTCLIEPDAVVQLSTAVAGVVAEVMADRGDQVQTGQILARLDSQLEQVALEMALARAGNEVRIHSLEARVAFLDEQAERTAQLAERNAISETTAREAAVDATMALQELAEAQLDLDLARLEVAQVRIQIEQKVLRAPFDGIVVERLLSPGEYREGQSHMMTVARLDPLRVEAFAPLDYYGRVAHGQPVTIRPEAPFEGAYPAEITVIDRVFDAATATFGLRMVLPNPDLALPAGLRCDVLFDAPALAARN